MDPPAAVLALVVPAPIVARLSHAPSEASGDIPLLPSPPIGLSHRQLSRRGEESRRDRGWMKGWRRGRVN